MLRSIAAVLVGYAITGLFIFCTDKIFSVAIPGFSDMHPLPTYYFMISIVTDTIYSVIGGVACATIARTKISMHILTLIAVGEMAGLAATIFNWGVVPHYFSLALMILYPPAVWIGGRTKGGAEKSRLASA